MTHFPSASVAAAQPAQPAQTTQPAQPPASNREEIRQTIQDAMEGVRAAAQGARTAGDAARQSAIEARNQARQDVPSAPPPPGSNDFAFRVGPDGLLIVQTNPDGTETSTPWDAGNVIPPQVTDILAIIAIGLVSVIMAFPIGRAIARYIDRRGHAPKVPDDVVKRLGSMEQSLDAIAIEVERMSEAHRFTTKLLSERVAAPDFRFGAADSAVPHAATRETVDSVVHRSDAIRG